jgi:shikimate kinase
MTLPNIILTGFMGTGKSTLGRHLAAKLGFRFRDLDDMIVAHESMSVNEIFHQKGEPYFRALETSLIRSISAEKGMVLSTGGGAVVAPENRTMLRNMGFVVNLCASPAALLERLAGENDRPLLRRAKDTATVIRMLQEREACYADADLRIDTTDKKMEAVADEIMQILARKN